MSAVATVTYTGKVGPGQTVTARVYNNVTKVVVDLSEQVLVLFGVNSGPLELDINPLTTSSISIASAGGNWTLTLS